MSARSGITKALVQGLKDNLNGVFPYVTNVYGSVDNKMILVQDVPNYPHISVTPGPEVREDMPSNITFGTVSMYIRIYVQNNEDAQGELEEIISDIETYLDSHLQVTYNVRTSSGSVQNQTITNTIRSINTDEGLLDPFALGEILVDIQYEKIRS